MMHGLSVLLAFAAALAAHAGPTVRYDVDLTRAGEQIIRVRMTLEAVDTPTLDVHLPVWRPGLYLILDQAGTVRRVAAQSGDTALPIDKVQKSSWRITTQGNSTITVDYDVWAASLDNRTRHADDTHAFMNPSTVFMYAHECRNDPCEITLTLPEARPGIDAWRVASGLSGGPAGDRRWTLSAPTYDILADSPIEAGVHHVIPFDVDGTPHEIVVWTGEPALADSAVKPRSKKWDRLAPDFAAIVRAQRDLFGSLPYERYVFLLHVYPGARGGTEHYNSTIMQAPPEALSDDTRYEGFLSLTSHEMFHTWNVKRFRPDGLTPYDYQRENYTTLLWVAEGSTTYFEDVILCRAGLMKPKDFLKTLADWIHTERTRPGSRVQSVAASSHDAWIHFNKRTADSVNSGVSFYDKGALVSFVLDAEIRRRNPDASLDTVMKRLFERFPTPDKGFSEADLRAILAETTPDDSAWIAEFFTNAVHGTTPLDVERALEVFGYELKPAAKGDDKAPEPWAGITLADEGGLARVTAVSSAGPGLALVPGDLVVALDARRVRAADWDKELAKRKVADTIRISFLRHDVLREATITLAAAPEAKSTIVKVKDPTEAQQRHAASWLGEPAKDPADKPAEPTEETP
jgi:predicted metalloprotease with PDZ domain